MLRGVADPLAAVYARCYLVRRGAALAPMEKSYLLSTFADFMVLHQVRARRCAENTQPRRRRLGRWDSV